eukprot:IDg4443t1
MPFLRPKGGASKCFVTGPVSQISALELNSYLLANTRIPKKRSRSLTDVHDLMRCFRIAVVSLVILCLQMALKEYAHKVAVRCSTHPRPIEILRPAAQFSQREITQLLDAPLQDSYGLKNVFTDLFSSMEIESSFRLAGIAADSGTG